MNLPNPMLVTKGAIDHSPARSTVSAVVLTFNEEHDISKCLQSLMWCDQVFVLDSGSTDNTVDLATRLGAIVVHQEFTGFGDQRNYALDHLPFIGDWVLFLDADEVATTAFASELTKAVAAASTDIAGYFCCWRMMLNQRWLKRCDNFPKWQLRVVRRGRARFVNFGHGQKEGEVNGKLDYIKTPYDHFAFSKGWSHWIARHNRYSTEEANSRLKGYVPFKQTFSGNPSRRNAALKYWLTRLPGWPLLRFFQAYLLKGGFLEGVDGLTYCVNIAYYEFLIKIKMREIRLQAQESNSPSPLNR